MERRMVALEREMKDLKEENRRLRKETKKDTCPLCDFDFRYQESRLSPDQFRNKRVYEGMVMCNKCHFKEMFGRE